MSQERFIGMLRRITLVFALVVLLPGIALLFAKPASAAACFMSEGGDFVCDVRPGAAPFAAPKPFPGSFLDRAAYARMADFTNVHDQPGGRVVRNAGDGFLFVTISGAAMLGDQLWYQINPGEYVRAEDLTMAEISEFTGVEVNIQPERPFGWVVLEATPSDEPDGEPNPDYAPLERYTFIQVFDAVVGEEDWLWYEIGDGRWIRQTFVSLVELTERPAEVGPNDFWTQVDLYEQTFAAYEGSRMVYASLISSGLNRWPTHQGLFQVWDRHSATKMSGAEGKIDYYFIEDVPHTMFFDNDIALHGAYWHDRFGYKHSHGCVNMPPRAAEWVYNWSAGTPHDLWVYVFESDPHAYFEKHE